MPSAPDKLLPKGYSTRSILEWLTSCRKSRSIFQISKGRTEPRDQITWSILPHLLICVEGVASSTGY